MQRALLLAALLAPLACGCSSVDEQVSSAIGAAVREGKVHKLRLASITNFEWDRLYLFDPYTPRNDVCKALHVQEKDCERVVPFESTDDGIMTMAFVSGKRVVCYSKHSRWNGDFAPSPKQQPIPAGRAVFQVTPSGTSQDGRPWLKLTLDGA